MRLAFVQLYARGYPPGLQITCINKVGDGVKLMLVPSVQVDSILSSWVPVCPVFLHGYFMPISPSWLLALLSSSSTLNFEQQIYTDCLVTLKHKEFWPIINPLLYSLRVVSASDWTLTDIVTQPCFRTQVPMFSGQQATCFQCHLCIEALHVAMPVLINAEKQMGRLWPRKSSGRPAKNSSS